MTTPLLGAYTPGRTLLHRSPASLKLLVLLAAGALVVTARGPWSALAFLGLALACVAWARMRARLLLASLRGLALVLVLLAGYQLWQRGWAQALESVADLVALVLLATVLTVTTPLDEVLDAVTSALRPLRRLGVDPERVALGFSLMIRAIPTTVEIADETRDAAVARGLQRDPRARLTPLVIRVVSHARRTGDALHARGIGD